MKYMIIFLLLFKCSLSFGQALSLDELLKVRMMNNPQEFRAFCSGKGYKINLDTIYKETFHRGSKRLFKYYPDIAYKKDSFYIEKSFNYPSLDLEYDFPKSQSNDLLTSLKNEGFNLIDSFTYGKNEGKTLDRNYSKRKLKFN